MYRRCVASGKYKYCKRKNHPLAPPSGRLPLHRVILYDKIGPGLHPCHRCGQTVNWSTTSRTGPGVLVAEHIDQNPQNNSPENLAPSCQSCNIRAGRDSRFENTPFIEVNGKRLRCAERVCEGCSTTFLIPLSELQTANKRGFNGGRFCSLKCLHNRDFSRD